jgi:hypothetical protein
MLNANDNQTTVYSITMEYNNVAYQQYMLFSPQNLNPVSGDEYFYIYNYKYLIYLVNQTIINCLNNLNALITLPDGINPPVMNFDITTQICSITLNDTQFGYNETGKINIYFNYPMYALFASIPAFCVNTNANGMDYQLNNLISQDTALLSQEYTTVPLWNPVSSVIFRSNLLPTNSSQTPPLQAYVNGKNTSNSSSINF